MRVTIDIDRQEVLQEVEKLTGFSARQVEGSFDKVAATADEERIVGTYCSTALNRLMSQFADYRPVKETEEKVSFDVPDTFEEAVLPLIAETVQKYLVLEVCNLWFAVTKPEAIRDALFSQSLIQNIGNLLSTRKKPEEAVEKAAAAKAVVKVQACCGGFEMIFTVLREEILQLVKLDSYYVGDRQKYVGSPVIIPAEKIQLSDSNDDILRGFIDSGASEVADILTGVLSKMAKEELPEVRFVFTLQVPATFDTTQTFSIEKGIRDVMVNYTLGEWYLITNPTVAGNYAARAVKAKDDLLHRINRRTQPVRRHYSPF